MFETSKISDEKNNEGNDVAQEMKEETRDLLHKIKAGKKEISNKKKSVNKSIKYPEKKIGPQKQKAVIHTLFKKARVYEIRKITRRIEKLKKLKGTNEQKAKNMRKVEKLLQELNAMKDFIIAKLTERTVNIFKGRADEIYIEYWISCHEPRKLEELLQRLSLSDNENKFSDIAFIKLLSSKDIIGKLKLISEGININPNKNKKKSRKAFSKNKKNWKNKFNRKAKLGQSEAVITEGIVKEILRNGESNLENLNQTSVRRKVMEDKEMPNQKTEVKKKKKDSKLRSDIKFDSFFLSDPVTHDTGEESSSDEFSAPIKVAQENHPEKKKNRMGQRQRKRLLNQSQADGKIHKTSQLNKKPHQIKSKFKKLHTNGQSKTFISARKHSHNTHSLNGNDSKSTKIIKDSNLHPSWLAKQKIKQKQGVTEFGGTRITFDE